MKVGRYSCVMLAILAGCSKPRQTTVEWVEGDIVSGDTRKQSLRIRNQTDGIWKVESIHTSCPCFSVEAKASVVKPGDELVLEASINTSGFVGHQEREARISVTTNAKDAYTIQILHRSHVVARPLAIPAGLTVPFDEFPNLNQVIEIRIPRSLAPSGGSDPVSVLKQPKCAVAEFEEDHWHDDTFVARVRVKAAEAIRHRRLTSQDLASEQSEAIITWQDSSSQRHYLSLPVFVKGASHDCGPPTLGLEDSGKPGLVRINNHDSLSLGAIMTRASTPDLVQATAISPDAILVRSLRRVACVETTEIAIESGENRLSFRVVVFPSNDNRQK